MSRLKIFSSPRRIVVAADGTLVPQPLAEQQRLRLLQQQQNNGALTQQLGGAVQQALPLLGSGGAGAAGAAGGAAAAGASAAGPIGLAIAGGMAVDGMIKSATTDENGFAKTNTASSIARGLGDTVNPIGNFTTAIGNLSNKDMTTAEKVGSFVPGLSSLMMRNSINKARDKYLAQKNKLELNSITTQNQTANYTGLAYARQGGVVPTFAEGGKPKEPPPAGQPRQGNAEQAKRYYDNVQASMQSLIGNKHDEVYTDPATGRAERANSCLSFACTVQEQATGQNIERKKQNLYNPEFTATAEQQGWVPIELKDARPGDRFQSWQPVGTATANDFKVADLRGRQLIPGRVPVHMTVFGGWQDKPTAGNPGLATVYQDGHQYRNADAALRPIREGEWVAYRYVGVNGQPTNDPQQAVAVNPAVQHRAQGGPAPRRIDPWRQPLSENDEVKYQQWVKKLPAGHRQSIDPATGNGRDYDYRRAFKEGVQAADNGHFTDRYKLPNHRTFSTESMYYNDQTKDQAGKWVPVPGGGNKWVPLNPKVKQEFVEDKNGRPVLGYAEGGTLPPSVIADGHLHSQKHTLNRFMRKPVTSKGIPIIQLSEHEHLNGKQLAELEKDELTMSAELSEKVNEHAASGAHEDLGRLLADQVLTNTIPSKRYSRRLAKGGQAPHYDNTGEARDEKSLAMLSADGGVQMWLKGGIERIMSREDTSEIVGSSLRARTPNHFRALGRRVSSMIAKQDKRAQV